MDIDSRTGDLKFCTRNNVLAIASIRSFASIRGGCHQECKDVYFVRCIGSHAAYLQEIKEMDGLLKERSKKNLGSYLRVSELPGLLERKDIERCSALLAGWENSGKQELTLHTAVQNPLAKYVLNHAFCRLEQMFKKYSHHCSESMVKNFLIKVIFWSQQLLEPMLLSWNGKNTDKFVFHGKMKKQEYLFCFFLTMLGIDVLLLLPEGDIILEADLLAMSEKIVLGLPRPGGIPRYEPKEEPAAAAIVRSDLPVMVKTAPNIRAKHSSVSVKPPKHSSVSVKPPKREELEFEELAMLASSVVMITIHDDREEIVGTGSGIMIGEKGYILTNHHVANGGRYYSVRIEGEESDCQTDEIIKYNGLLDLSVIRIDRSLTPIPLYKGEKPLVRGQKVVAIGSPLGLFNSVSDGIISGFREIHDVDMIQFTAPTSHGSSGGAVLNMYGEVIGISTAGYDSGQNINLAVDYKNISKFIAGFV